MRILLLSIVASLMLIACNNGDKIPDVSAIKVDIKTQRFEEDLFRIDSSNLFNELNKLKMSYPTFFEDYCEKILGIDGSIDTTEVFKAFISSYKPIYDSCKLLFNDFSSYEKDIKNGLQFVKHYFQNYNLPNKIITFVGPLDASFGTSNGLQGDITTDNGSTLGIGLQLHLGNGFSFYQSEQGQQLYPTYISNRFNPENIVVNTMRNIVDNIYPEKLEDKSLLQQMVEKGKHLYILNKILPKTKEHLLIGYTEQQLKDCYSHEKAIWDLFVQNNFLQTIDNNIIKNYIGVSPKTQELGEASPGNIGSYAGWQIVKKYMKKNSSTTLQQLIALDNETIFNDAKYKP